MKSKTLATLAIPLAVMTGCTSQLTKSQVIDNDQIILKDVTREYTSEEPNDTCEFWINEYEIMIKETYKLQISVLDRINETELLIKKRMLPDLKKELIELHENDKYLIHLKKYRSFLGEPGFNSGVYGAIGKQREKYLMLREEKIKEHDNHLLEEVE